MHIIPIILSHWISNGFAPSVIANGTETTEKD